MNCKSFKMSIDTCLGGEEAIEKFLNKNKPNSKDPYNYIFLDWNMPIMDGYETSSKIKFFVKDESYLDCPIIICTAYEGKIWLLIIIEEFNDFLYRYNWNK